MRVAFLADHGTADGVQSWSSRPLRFPSGAGPGKDVEGARSAASPAEAARAAEVVWMCVSTPNAVEGVLFGPQGVREALAEGMTIVDSSHNFAVRNRQVCRES